MSTTPTPQSVSPDFMLDDEPKPSNPAPALQPANNPAPAAAPPKASVKGKKKLDRSSFVSQDSVVGGDGIAMQTQFPLRRPGNQNFFRVCPDPSSRLYGVDSIEGDMGKIYLIHGDVPRTPDLLKRIRSVNLFTCINHKQQAFVWPIRNSGSPWSKSAMEMARAAETKWIRIVANSFAQGYDLEAATPESYPKLAATEPAWPMPGADILDAAMEAAAITDPMDSVLREILGGLL